MVVTDEEHSQWWDQKGEMDMTWEEFFRYATAFIPVITMSGEIHDEED